MTLHHGERSLGLYFFSALEDGARGDAAGYRLLLDAARAADDGGLDFLWLPERHFTPFGGAHPNPSVLAAAVAVATRRIRIRAGSVVLPLHDPLRVAEEWAVVDNLSDGRVEIASAAGWNPRDFVLSPEAYADRAARAHENLRTVRELWAGGEVCRTGALGERYAVRSYPRPVQAVLPHWVTAAGNPETFEYAGRIGAGVLTSYGAVTAAQLTERIAAYRRAFEEHHGGTGRVSVMAHAAIGASGQQVRSEAEQPLRRYLASYASQQEARGDQRTVEKSLDFAAQRYLRGRSLIGDRNEALAVLQNIFATGADEVACLVDFGVPRRTVLGTVDELAEIQAALLRLP
ncbi:natural product biosynthesis luciferase-like monooxygenase protein [Kitasatospora sp. GP30]|uniref:MupA/Atu3671 family FMN-dependent luciferase-like monooxygenase n=1 Tax=Kitasatospora sp. GP30 TaxID=3035084 RepID=UPI000C714BAA|nr:MupA/Atu3671 family FMN-dependent luciferase-like monooxygenase [Kitasatospora sp. GP30]MDH6145172.1 natural product biosynthesis luciferase-like monooxygenase protein [Kitasatospora sp. GP30]